MHSDGEHVEVGYTPEGEYDYVDEIWKKLSIDAFRKSEIHGFNKCGAYTSPIEVNKCNFNAKENAKSHYTGKYDLLGNQSPIFRRGKPFRMTIEFNRPFNMDSDVVKLKLSFGPEVEGLNFALLVTSSKIFTKETSEWDITLLKQESAVLTVQIQIPHTSFVGLWRMQLISQIKGNEESKTHDCKENIYILFNPWCKEDPFYMDGDANTQEYVLNDFGKMYQGNEDNFITQPWTFNQFSSVALATSIFILEKSGLDFAKRGDPIEVARTISKMVQHVIVGRWKKPYRDGIHPSVWTGSEPILERYFASKGSTRVKYGQCWVFAGVNNTVYRALGIPCRAVTNFRSANDDDVTLTVTEYFDDDGKKIKDKRKLDFVWNYHVWNEFWMTRLDMPSKEYSGWQAMDGHWGPASLIAIKKGEVRYAYDVARMFSSVNADIVRCQYNNESKEWKLINRISDDVGKRIVTRKAGIKPEIDDKPDDVEDLTLTYKFKEGTVEERQVFIKTWEERSRILSSQEKRPSFMHIYTMPEKDTGDVDFKLRRLGRAMIGKELQIVLDIENKSDEKRTVTSRIHVSTEYYDVEVFSTEVKDVKRKLTIERRQKKQLKVDITLDDYLDKLMDNYTLNIYVFSRVIETEKTFVGEMDFQIDKPSLTIEVEKTLKMKKTYNLEISFTNPLQRPLENCSLTINGPGLVDPLDIWIDNIGPEKEMTHFETLPSGHRIGVQIITVTFWSKQLTEVHASKIVVVEV